MSVGSLPKGVHDEPLCPVCGFPVEMTQELSFRCDLHGVFDIEDCTWIITDRDYLDNVGQ